MTISVAYAGVLQKPLTRTPYDIPATAIGANVLWDNNSADATVSEIQTTTADGANVNKAYSYILSPTDIRGIEFNNAAGAAFVRADAGQGMRAAFAQQAQFMLSSSITDAYHYAAVAYPVAGVSVVPITMTQVFQQVHGLNGTACPQCPGLRIGNSLAKPYLFTSPEPPPTKFVQGLGPTFTDTLGLTGVGLTQYFNSRGVALQETVKFVSFLVMSIATSGGTVNPQVWRFNANGSAVQDELVLQGGPAGSAAAFATPAQRIEVVRAANFGFIVKLSVPIYAGMGARYIFINASLDAWYDIQLSATDAGLITILAFADGLLTMDTNLRFFYKSTFGAQRVFVGYSDPVQGPTFVTPYMTTTLPDYYDYDMPPGLRWE